MHNPQTQIVKTEVIGMGADGIALNRWTEADGRTFEERYDRLTAASGITYGVARVYEITA